MKNKFFVWHSVSSRCLTLSCYLLLFLCLFSLLLPCPAAQAGTTYGQSNDSEEYYLNMTKVSLLPEESVTLTVEGVSDEEVSFKSEDSSIVSVGSSEGNSCECVGQSVGSTVITVKVKKKRALFFMNSTTTLRCKITVNPNAVSVKFKKRKYKMMVGQKKKACVVLRPSITSEIPVFTTSNPKVATVSTKGRITAKSTGVAIITATLKNGTSAQCRVIVSNDE